MESIFIIFLLELLTIAGIFKTPFAITSKFWMFTGKALMFSFIAIDLLWINNPCKNGMVCRRTTNIYIIYCVLVMILCFFSITMKSRITCICSNIILSSGFLLQYAFFHQFCKKPDMRCIVYTKPHIITYGILLVVFAIIELICLFYKERKETS